MGTKYPGEQRPLQSRTLRASAAPNDPAGQAVGSAEPLGQKWPRGQTPEQAFNKRERESEGGRKESGGGIACFKRFRLRTKPDLVGLLPITKVFFAGKLSGSKWVEQSLEKEKD